MFKTTESHSQSNEKQTPVLTRSIARKLARPLSLDELNAVAAGTTTCSCCADDCDAAQQ